MNQCRGQRGHMRVIGLVHVELLIILCDSAYTILKVVTIENPISFIHVHDV